jgi:malonyl-CoA decarboxylase
MVNYLYDLTTIEANHEDFARSGTVVRSSAVETLVAGPSNDPKGEHAPDRLARLYRTQND